MRFAVAAALAALHAAACRSETAPAEPAVEARVVADLSRERGRIEEAEAALTSVDLDTARAKTVEALGALLARSEAERDAAWLALLERAAWAAWGAQDLEASKRAWGKLLEIRTRVLPEDHADLQKARQYVANTLMMSGDLEAARKLQQQVLEARARTLPADDLELLRARGNLAITLFELGNLEDARALFEQVLEVFSRTQPADHPDIQRAKQGLAATLSALGDLENARKLEEQVLEVRLRTLPEDDRDVQTARENLAVTLSRLGDLQGARVLLEHAVEAYARTFPADHISLQTARGNLAAGIRELGDLQGARALQEQVLEVCSHTLPDDHFALQAARGNLSGTLQMLGEYESARVLQEQVLEVCSRTLADDHPDLQRARGHLAATLRALDDLEGARALEEKVLEVLANTVSEDNLGLQLARQSLAGTLGQLGDVAGARKLLEQVFEVSSRTLAEDSPWLQSARADLALMIAADAWANPAPAGEVDRKERERERCVELLLARCRAQTAAARTALLSASVREAQARCEDLGHGLALPLSLATGFGGFDPALELDRASFELSETTRGAALGSATLMRRAAGSPEYAELREKLRGQAHEIVRLAQGGTTSEGFHAALSRREATERDLLELAQRRSVGLDFDADALAARLDPGEAAVALRRYPRWGIGDGVMGPTDSLCAFVLRREGAEPGAAAGTILARVELGPIAPIEEAVDAWREALGVGEGRGVGVPASGPSGDENARGREIRRLVVDPWLPALHGAERVVIALDDVLHLVPLDVLPLETQAGSRTELLGDRYRIETRCTLAELLALPELSGPGDVVVIGGADFESAPLALDADEAIADAGSQPPGATVAHVLRGGAWGQGFSPLPATGVEALEIASMHGLDAFLLRGRRASRAALEALAPRARFLHVASHGWFAPESIRSWKDDEPLDARSGSGVRLSGEARIRGMSPMLLCGLALAGANLREDGIGRAPGLITAEEMAAMDLTNCELAVLSACDTNVGERRAGQGVASLQLALQMAGARSVITSLWKVPDEATRELMVDFYRRLWVEKEPKWRALWEAKKLLRDAVDERGRPRYSTRDWGAWVLTGDTDRATVR